MRIAIIGGGISGLAAAWQAQQDGLEFELFEAGERFGGVLETLYTEAGLPVEGGAESCLRSKPELLELCREIGLEGEIISTLPENSGAYVVRDGQLHAIPKGFRLMAPSALLPFLRSDLISWSGKLRTALDLVLPARERGPEPVEESLAEFVTRRLGAEVFDYLAQPLVAGIYGADPQVLSLEATMPLFPRLEQEYGSVIKGLRALGSEGDAQGARYNLFFSLKGGFGQLVRALTEQLTGGALRLSARVDELSPTASGWSVKVEGEPARGFDSVVVALPAPVAADLVKPFLPEVSESLQEITYRPAVTVNLSFDRATYLHFVPPAYGFVVPAQERRPLLACTFSSRKWPGRGDEEMGVLRTYFGGPGMEWALKASDDDLVAVSMTELDALLGLPKDPLEFSVHRFPHGLPEYRIGHRQRVQRIKQALGAHPTLALAGNYLDGVGLPDCVRLGRRAVSQVELPVQSG